MQGTEARVKYKEAGEVKLEERRKEGEIRKQE